MALLASQDMAFALQHVCAACRACLTPHLTWPPIPPPPPGTCPAPCRRAVPQRVCGWVWPGLQRALQVPALRGSPGGGCLQLKDPFCNAPAAQAASCFRVCNLCTNSAGAKRNAARVALPLCVCLGVPFRGHQGPVAEVSHHSESRLTYSPVVSYTCAVWM